jgi:hypothetical protein
MNNNQIRKALNFRFFGTVIRHRNGIWSAKELNAKSIHARARHYIAHSDDKAQELVYALNLEEYAN